MTLQEFCRESGLSKRRVRSYIREGRIQPKRSGFRYVFSQEDLQKAYMGPFFDQGELAAPIQNAYPSSSRQTDAKEKGVAKQDQVMKNVHSQHALRRFKWGVVIFLLLFILLLFIWNNFRSVSITFSLGKGSLTESNMTPSQGSYYMLTHEGNELPQTFYTRSDLDISINSDGHFDFTSAEITVRLPVRLALQEHFKISGLRLTDAKDVIQRCLIQSTEYMRYIYITEISG